jgi:hypothetical protein
MKHQALLGEAELERAFGVVALLVRRGHVGRTRKWRRQDFAKTVFAATTSDLGNLGADRDSSLSV